MVGSGRLVAESIPEKGVDCYWGTNNPLALGLCVMHTAEELATSSFDYRVSGKPVSRSEVMPDITLDTRVGIVMGTPTEGIDAGNFVLSCVTAFYDHLRSVSDGFFEYPDYYTFQCTSEPADYRMLDIYPGHKNVPVDPDIEELARAIVDRAIDVLLVPNTTSDSSIIADITRRSLERRIDGCYQYAGRQQLAESDFSIGLPRHLVEDWYDTTIGSVDDSAATTRQTALSTDCEQITQHFRQISLEKALGSLPVQVE